MHSNFQLRFFIFGALLLLSEVSRSCSIQLISDQILCYGTSVTLSPVVNPAGGTYLWSTGETTPTITVSPLVNTSYTITYTNGPCVVSKTVNVIVVASNVINEVGIAVCTDENGDGLANLLQTGLVTFWEDALATIPITNPAAYPVQITGSRDTVYATTGSAPCYDVLYRVLLCKHKKIDQSAFTISQFPEEICEIPNSVYLIYTAPQSLFTDLCPGFAFTSTGSQSGYPGAPWISTNGFAYPFAFQNGNFSFTAFGFSNVEQDITISFDQIYYYSTNCPLVDFEPDITFVIESNLINLSVNDLTTCEGSSVDLNALATTTSSLPITFHSSPSASAASLITSPYTVNSTQTIYAKITNPNPFCENIKPIEITVLPIVQVTVSDGEVCQDQSLDLSSLTVSPASSGVWSGSGINNNVFTSSTPGTYTLTYTPSAPCYLADEVVIDVLPQPLLSLGSSTLCDISGVFQLSNIQDPAFSVGQWSGTNVSNGAFDPAGLQGNYTLTFTPAAQYVCAQPATTQVTVTKAVEPLILDQLFCETQGLVDLNSLVPPPFLGGTWSGQGTSGSSFNPAGIFGAALLNYNAPSACALPTDVLVEVQSAGTPAMFDVDWCDGSASLDLRTLEDPFYGGGTWLGSGVFGTIWDPIGQNTVTTLTYNSNNFCTNAVAINITLYEPVKVEDMSVVCNGDEYTVSFNIEGGNPEKWLVNGQPAANTYIFGPIASDTSYLIEVTDSSRCSTVILEGTKKCACLKDAGTLIKPADTLVVCHSDTLRLTHNNDALLQAGDSLTFIFHDSPGWSPGNIIAISNTPVFVKPPGIEYNRVYYVSPLAAEVLNDTLNLADPCLSLKAGVPVMFYQPAILPSKDSVLCRAVCASYPISFQGTAPYRAIVSWGFANWMINDTLLTFKKDTVIQICPQSLPSNIDTILVNLVQISDQRCEGSPKLLGRMVLATPNVSVVDPLLCSYDSLVFRGKVYKKNAPVDTLLLKAVNTNFCDTTIIVAPRFLKDASQLVARQLCTGQSISINGQIYDESKPSGIEVLPASSAAGCDSTIIVDLTFGNLSVNEFSTRLCRGDSLVINGKVYNADNLSGEVLLPGAASGGCDSLIRVSIQLEEQAVSLVNPVLCKGQSIKINDVVYNENKQQGQEIIKNGSALGCDSVINVALQFSIIDTTYLKPRLCAGDSIVILNTVFNAANPIGNLTYQTAAGCDSVVQVSVDFYDQPIGNYNASICRGDTLVVNGVAFYGGNEASTILLKGAAASGCDSLLNVSINFLNESKGVFAESICDGDSVLVAGVYFFRGKTEGSIILEGAAADGCDSILDVKINILPERSGSYEATICEGDTLEYAGDFFYKGKNTGQIKLVNASQEGCDSLVNIVVTILPRPEVDTVRILADQESATFELGGVIFDFNNPMGIVKLPGNSSNGCDSFAYVIMEFPQTFRNLEWSTSPASCSGKEDGSFIFSGADGCVPDRIIVNGIDYPITSLPFTIGNLKAGQYAWRLESKGRCSYESEFVIEENEGTEFIVDPKIIELPARSETLVSIRVSPEPSTIQWLDAVGFNCDDCLMPVVTAPGSMAKYQLQLGDENGCKRDYEITFIPLETINVWPNVIYLDGGGVNSVFRVPNDNNTLNSVAVYDRWGNALVRQNNFVAGQAFVWDGTAGNQRVMQGVYLVAIQYNDGNTEWLELTIL